MKISLTKCIGALAAVVGAAWVWTCFFRPMFRSIGDGDIHGIAFGLSMGTVLSIPGIFGLVYGFKLIREPNKVNITRTIGSLLCFVVMWGSSEVSEIWESSSSTVYGFMLPILSLALMPVYVWVAKAVMHRERLFADGLHDFFGKPFIVLFALGVYSSVQRAFDFFGPTDFLKRPDEPYAMLWFLMPIIVGCVVYKIFSGVVGLEPHGVRTFFSKRFVFLLSILIWGLTSSLFHVFTPIEPGYQYVPVEPWGILGFLVPFLLAWIFYMIIRAVVEYSDKQTAPNGPTHA